MRIFHLTSIAFTGYIEFQFNDLGLLDKMNILAELGERQQVFLLRNMPREILELEKLKTANVTLTEIKQDITFDMFWDKYDDKINSSRKRALSKRERMNPTDRIRAFWFISKYFSSIPSGTRKKFAETYLYAELWNN